MLERTAAGIERCLQALLPEDVVDGSVGKRQHTDGDGTTLIMSYGGKAAVGGYDANPRVPAGEKRRLFNKGIRRLRLMTNNPRKIAGLEGYGIEIAERVPIVIPANAHDKRYLDTKKSKMGHLI